MNWLTQIKIGPRLALAFGTVLMLSLALMLVGMFQVNRLGTGLTAVSDYDERIVVLIDTVHIATLERALAVRTLAMQTDATRSGAELDRITQNKKVIDDALQSLATLAADPQLGQKDDVDAARQMKELEARYWPVAENVVNLLTTGKHDEGVAKISSDVIPLLAEVKTLLKKVGSDNQRGMQETVAGLQRDAGNSRMVLSGLGALMLLIGIALAWAIQRSVVAPLNLATKALRDVASGDLTQTIQSSGRDEVAEMMGELSRMQEQLRKVVGTIRHGVDSVGVASAQIATGNQDLSERTEQTASNLQQAASAMEQLTGTVKQSADSARQANQLASSAADVAQRGGTVVSQVVTTMDEINASSKKIVDIIGVIDGIAFQTNILALNAAVEAARAGEQGRGFAVVASEVRSLAQRSADAAKEIKTLIGASVDKVEGGSRLVADAGRTMTEIVGSVQRVSDIIGEITAAAAEQSQGINQVNGSVNQLDQMTQQNAALVEESAAAAESLRAQAAQLSQVVSVFRLDHASLASSAMAPAKAYAPVKASSMAKPKTAVAKPAAKSPTAASKAAPTQAPATATVSAGGDGGWETF